MCIIGSERIMFEVGYGGPPSEFYLAIFIQSGAILSKNDRYMHMTYIWI